DDSDAHRHDPGCGHLRRSASGASAPAAVVGRAGGDLDATTSSRIEARRGAGAPLPGAVRGRMESAFGTSLGHVRVHDGPEAAALSGAISADAFTTGSDIFFGAGRFAPQSPDGERMLAHEIAHVVTEAPGVRRWPWSKETPEQKAAKEKKDAEKAERDRKVKESKKTEKTEKASLKAARVKGEAGRQEMKDDLYGQTGPDQGGPSETNVNGTFTKMTSGAGAEMKNLYELMDKAREREVELFAEMKENKLGGSDEKRAKLVYKQVWYVEFPQLEHVRPPRETPAEQLVAQVRQVRSEAEAGATAEANDQATLKERMISSAAEKIYDRMANERDDLLAKDPDASPWLAQDEAREKVLKTVDAKALAALPPKDGPIDVAAWAAADERAKARARQRARDEATITANLDLLPPDQRIGPQPKPSGGGLDKGIDVMDKVGKYGGMGAKAVDKIGGGIAGKIGKGQDKKLRDQQGIVKDKEPKSPVPGALDPLGVGGAYTAGAKAHSQLKKNQREAPEQDLPESDATKASAGIGSMTSILTSLVSAVQSGMAMAKSIQTAWSTKDPYEGLKAAKSGASGLDGLVSAAKSTAELAKTIDGGVAAGVKSVVPGLDIATSALAIVRGITDVATVAMRQRETDTSMFEARVGSTDSVNVMVYPLMKVSQVYTKQLEQNSWSLGASILDFSLAIAQVASGGGFGIPAAIKASAAVVDKLHSLAHYIADSVLAVQAKRAEKESAVLHLEGAAEDELKKHPKMAVDGIVIKAAQGDKVAIAFLGNYRIDGKPITRDYVAGIKPKPLTKFDPSNPKGGGETTSDDARLLKVREVVLGQMGTDADPQHMFDDLKAQMSSVTGKASAFGEAWDEAGALKDKRNSLAGEGKLGENKKDDRGIFWQLRMTLSSSKREKLKNRTTAFDEGVEALPQGIACAVGTHTLALDSDPTAMKAFIDGVTAAEIESELGRTPRRNTPDWIAFLRDALKQKKAAEAAAKKAPVSIGSHRK
ncbi:MAG TPA: DUF4157 domain-containing protein, partial [Cellulomonas sp.]|nr:DUF4157 domain-containing protein [Cellulomonas sp.]